MHFFLHFLGLVAFVSDWLSRISVRGVPANWVVVGFLVVGAGAATESWHDAHLNGTRPQKMSIARFMNLANARYGHWYVGVEGVVVPRARLGVKKSVGDRPTYDLVAFLDERGREGIWLKTAPGQYAGRAPFRARIEGLMGRPSSDFETHLVEGVPSVGSALMHRQAWLEADNKPPTAFWPAFSIVACSLVALALIGSSLARNIIFWPQNAAPVTPKKLAPGEPVPLRVTGRLRENAKSLRRLNWPAQTLKTQSGALAISATTDPTGEAGSRVRHTQPGQWILVPGRECKIRSGVLAHGPKLFPALKIEFNDTLNKDRRATAILACDDPETRAAVLEQLSASSGTASPFQSL